MSWRRVIEGNIVNEAVISLSNKCGIHDVAAQLSASVMYFNGGGLRRGVACNVGSASMRLKISRLSRSALNQYVVKPFCVAGVVSAIK